MILTNTKQALNQIDQYNQDATQMLLRAADGCGGTWVRHGHKANLADLIKGTVNDNQKGE